MQQCHDGLKIEFDDVKIILFNFFVKCFEYILALSMVNHSNLLMDFVFKIKLLLISATEELRRCSNVTRLKDFHLSTTLKTKLNKLDREPRGVSLRGNDTNFHAYSINICTLWMSDMVGRLSFRRGRVWQEGPLT